MLLRLSYLALTGMITLLRLLPMSNTDKNIEILTLRHQLAIRRLWGSETRCSVLTWALRIPVGRG